MTDWPKVMADHGPLVWRTAYRLLGNHADAADCFQRAFAGAAAVAAAGPVRHWPALLARLATARALDALRARYRAAGPLPDDLPAGGADALDAAAAGELADALRAALAAIDPDQAQAFCLVCLEGLSNTEAAAQLGVTAGHAGVLLHRGRQQLRLHLKAFDPAREAL